MARFKSRGFKISAVMALVAATVFAMAGQVKAADAITFGLGFSTASDSTAAMLAAADSAKAKLGDKTATVVLAQGSMSACAQLATKFSTKSIYGIPALNSFCQDGRDKKAIVMAFAGEMHAAHSFKPNSNFQTAGADIGTALKAVTTDAGAGKIIIIVGSCNNPSDGQVVTGLLSTYGNNANTWVLGGSSGQFFADSQSKSNNILGILLWGEFDCRFGLEQGGSTGTSQSALNSAKDANKNPNFAIIFDCISRHEGLGSNGLTTEFNQITTATGSGVPFMAGYYLGEIGKKNMAGTAYGTGGAFSVANFYIRQATVSIRDNRNFLPAGQNNLLPVAKGSAAQYRINGSLVKGIKNQSASIKVSKHGIKCNLSNNSLSK